MIGLGDLCNRDLDPENPVLLFKEDEHTIYWLGTAEESAFRCNVYLILDGDQALLIDPGGKHFFEEVKKRLQQLISVEQLVGLIISHQDPDVAASMHQWLHEKPSLKVFASPRTHVLLPYYCHGEYIAHDTEQEKYFRFTSGNRLHFIPAPFLHFPGSVTTLDCQSGYLFSGDVWAALDTDWRLTAKDFSRHTSKMDLFHKDYLPSNVATRGYTESLAGLSINAILPQHGSILPKHHVQPALEYLKNLRCGLDLLYPDIESSSISSHAATEVQQDEASAIGTTQQLGTHENETISLQGNLRAALAQAARHATMRDQALQRLKVAELCLKKNELKLKEAQKIGHIGHWEWDLRTKELIWSDAIFQIFGHEQESFIPSYKAFLRCVHPEDRQALKHTFIQTIRKNIPYDITHRIIDNNGKIRTVYTQGRVKNDKKGSAMWVFGTIQDITDFTTIAEQLAKKNSLIDTIQRMQSRFIEQQNVCQIYNALLDDLLQLTESQYGFIGVVLESPEGAPYLLFNAWSHLVLNRDTEELFTKFEGEGLELHNLNNLFGAAVTSEVAVFSNELSGDSRNKDIPIKYPKLKNFLGIPIRFGPRVVGEIGLANREGGYNQQLLDHLAPLLAALGQIIVARQDQKARQIAEQALSKEAQQDGLLAIPNRRFMETYLAKQIKNAIRNQEPFSVIMLDVDFFKLYNDTYGHHQGDQCLKSITNVIQASMTRPLDIVARYGGEEFCCILPGTSERGVIRVAETIQEAIIAKAIPHQASTISEMVTVSMGTATWKPGTELPPEKTVIRADEALYKAKQSGRKSIVAASPSDKNSLSVWEVARKKTRI